MRCSNCGADNDEQTLNCTNCGTELQLENNATPFDKKRVTIFASCAAVFIFIMCIIFSVILPHQAAEKMQKAFDSKLGENVISVFEDYCGDYSVVYDDLSKSGQVVFLKFEECISDAKTDLNEQPVDTDINNYLLESTGDIFLPQDYSAVTAIAQYNLELTNVVDSYYNLYHSKVSYGMGTTAYSQGDYSTAASEFSNVIESDSWYEEAQKQLSECQKKLLEEEIAAIDSYINSGDYKTALQQVNSLRSENLTDEMKTKLDEYETKIYEAQLAEIEEFINDGNIEGAKEYVESLGASLSDDAQTRLEQALKNKAGEYLTKAAEALKNGERQGAYDMAVMAQTLCPDDAEIQKKVEYYKEYLPFALYKEENYLSQEEGEGYWKSIYYNMKCTANNSKTMQNCIYVFYDRSAILSSNLLYSVTYNLGEKYNEISGEQFVLFSSRNDEQNGHFELYGDGKKIFTSDSLGVNYLPKSFTVDVTGISTLNIKYYGDTNKRKTVYYGISNLVATKNLPE